MYTLLMLRMKIEAGLPVKNWIEYGPHTLTDVLNHCSEVWALDFLVRDEHTGKIHAVEWRQDEKDKDFEVPFLGDVIE